MKKNLVIFVVATIMLLGVSTASMADTIKLTDGPGSVTAGLFYAQTGDWGTFGTFCLETNEYLYLGTTYSYTIDTYAIAGGSGGSYEIESGVYGDPISYATAYLYTMFRSGAYKITDFEMSALQVAFWILEDENYLSISGVSAEIVARAKELVAEAEAADWTDIGNVRVANIYDSDGNMKQSVLILVPEPMTLILLGFGLVGLGFTRRFKK